MPTNSTPPPAAYDRGDTPFAFSDKAVQELRAAWQEFVQTEHAPLGDAERQSEAYENRTALEAALAPFLEPEEER